MTRKMTRTKLSIEQAYVVLSQDKKASIEVVDADIYQRLDANYDGFGFWRLHIQLFCCCWILSVVK